MFPECCNLQSKHFESDRLFRTLNCLVINVSTRLRCDYQ